MKKWLSAICIILMLVSLTACDASEKQYIEAELDPDTGIIMKTAYPVYDKNCEQISFIIENNSEERIEFGSDWWLERLSGKRWKRVNWEIPTAFTDILYFSEPGVKRYFQCSLKPFQKGLKDGRYRFIKEIEGAWYTAEFEIGDSPITAETPFGFLPLEDLPQNYSPEDAAADGVVVLRDGGIVNGEIMTAFFSDWNSFDFCGQLRVMNETEGGWVVTDLIRGDTRDSTRLTCRIVARRDGASDAVSTAYYSFFHVEDGRAYLSNRRNFTTHDGVLPLYGGIALPQEIADRIEDYRGPDNGASLIVYSPDGKIRATIREGGGLSIGTVGWGTVCGGEFSGKTLLDLVWQDDNTLLLIADGGEPGLYFYEFMHVDAEDMKSIRTLSYTYSTHAYVRDEEGRILIPE
ncbi:MAG: hypothetical protein IJW99_11605 [Clostridia bacterium]|nr:hypothetical protein [Clostridia bacterium]